jgi:hypothetical protein
MLPLIQYTNIPFRGDRQKHPNFDEGQLYRISFHDYANPNVAYSIERAAYIGKSGGYNDSPIIYRFAPQS